MQTLEIKYKHILYTTEFSEKWEEVFCHALGIAKQFNAKLTVLYVLNTELIDLLTFDIGLERRPSIDRKFSEAKEFTTKTRKKIIKKISDYLGKKNLNDINILVERGNPVTIILSVAERIGCDLIVMGFKERSNLVDDYVIGSTVNKVLHKSKLPILVVHKT